MSKKFSNNLAGESSLYLQQHAHNPVDWHPWSKEIWQRAAKENKLVLVSIGYSSCHWCHVMEHETFTDEATAKIMNENYFCIKVDREERPDIDQVYMNAVQLMTGHGGWPLNCFTLPDGRPVYGGTYFPKHAWNELLVKLKDFYDHNRDKAEEYASELLAGVRHGELIDVKTIEGGFDREMLRKSVDSWKTHHDNIEGGPARAPKFPMPVNYSFLLRYGHATVDNDLLRHVNLTLEKMAFGGIYDQLAGGFARYSTDSFWKVPHFEKMLYDNAQLISLYSEAYKLTKNELYRDIVEETIGFMVEEMSDGKGNFYSAFDADSEGEEGLYYVWKPDEIQSLDFGSAETQKILMDFFSLNNSGHWENGNYILLRKFSDQEIAARNNVSVPDLKKIIANAKQVMLTERKKRIPPALDKKVITSWNALMISGLCKAFQAFGNKEFLSDAIHCATQIMKNAVNDDGNLLHTSSQKSGLTSGFLEDYAFTILAMLDLYESTFDEEWLFRAKNFCDDAIKNFYDDEDGFFWFTPMSSTDVIARKKEISDNVIPGSNSAMAHSLFLLSEFLGEKKYNEMATQMLEAVVENVLHYPSSYANWARLMMNYIYPFREVVISGKLAGNFRKDIFSNYLPDAIIAGTEHSSKLPLLENRIEEGKTLIFICSNKTCLLPIEDPSEAITLLKSN